MLAARVAPASAAMARGRFGGLGAAWAPTPNLLIFWRARQESNLYQELRKLSFYPLNYGREEAVLYLKQESPLGAALGSYRPPIVALRRDAPTVGTAIATKGGTPTLYNPAFARAQVES